MNTIPEITTSVKNEISSNTLIISDNIPSLLTCTNNINYSEEPLIDNLIPEIIVNNFDSTISNDQMGICDKLRNWNVEFNVSHNCLNKLLNILKSEGLNVPKDGRTLMNTPKKHNILSMEPSAYVPFDINQIISSLLHKHEFDLSDITDLKLGVNVDGLPISKSSKSQFWPILISICNGCM